LKILDTAPTADPIPWQIHFLRAQLLLDLDQLLRALVSLEQCMTDSLGPPRFGALLPRTVDELQRLSTAE
jgi:hypothetical protein